MYAARKQQAPRIPSLWTLRPSVHPSVWQPDEKAKQLLQVSGTRFRDGLQDPYLLDDELAAALVALSDVSVALDHFHRRGGKVFKAAHVWLENSDWATHQLLSTPSFLKANGVSWSLEDLPEAGSVDPNLLLCEICRLVAMMHMDITIFPSGREAGVRVRLAREIYALLELLQQVIPSWKDQHSVHDLVLWASLMCSIGMLPQDVEDSYINFIAETYSPELLKDWKSVESSLRAFLWLGPTCTELAQDICRAALAVQDVKRNA